MHPDDIDELVAQAQRTPRSALDRWRSTSSRVLGGEAQAATPADGRRQFLRLGGGTVLAAAVLAACGSDEEVPPSETGVTTPEQATTTIGPAQPTTPEAGMLQDQAVARTHRTFELAAVQVYEVLLGDDADVSGDYSLTERIQYDGATESAMRLLRDRHESHAEYLVSVVEDTGGDPVEEPNQGVLDGLLAPVLGSLTTERSVLQLLATLESIGASTYAWGAGTMTTPALRQALMTVGAIAARQASVPLLLLQPSGLTAVPTPLIPTSGPARLPEQMLVGEDMDGGDAMANPPDPAESTDGEDDEGDDSGAQGG